MWTWLKRTTNQKTLAFLCGGLAAAAIASWTVYTHFYPGPSSGSKPSIQADHGVAAGGNVDVGGDLTIREQNTSADPAK